MPIVVGFAEPDMFLLRAFGQVTYADTQGAIDAILAHPGYARSRKVLVDGRGVTGAPSTGELRRIARDLKPLIDRGFGPMAFLSDTAFVHGVARMFTVFAEVFGLRARTFRKMEEAESWLREQEPAIVTSD